MAAPSRSHDHSVGLKFATSPLHIYEPACCVTCTSAAAGAAAMSSDSAAQDAARRSRFPLDMPPIEERFSGRPLADGPERLQAAASAAPRSWLSSACSPALRAATR